VGAEDDELILVAATEPEDGPLVGKRLSFGSRGQEDGAILPLMSRAYELGQAQGEGRLFALPALVGGRVVAVLGFLGATQIVGSPAQALAEGAAALYAEAFLLRRQVAEEARRRSSLEAEGVQARPLRPRPGSPGAIPPSPQAPSPLLGLSQAMAEVRAFIERVAPTESTVLLLGESGTGKEVAARVIHGASTRAAGPFVAVNCAALPPALIESELFGHEKGSFTGALARRLGRFELASGGTLFLDEVAEIPLGLQAKLLRVLQERSFERVGGTRPIKAELRILAATNRDLEAEVAAGRFRADLYWRLAVFPLRMPPLRERGGDIVLLADHFTECYAASTGRPVSRISTPALDLLTSYHWPGNVRELQNAIERAVILSTDGVIHAYHLPPSLQSADSTGTGPASTLDAALARLERELLVESLKIEAGNAAAAARRLGVSERRMGLALKRYGIDWRRFRRLGR
jgi:Nif-specific regulatory protein